MSWRCRNMGYDGAQSLFREFFLMPDKHLSVEQRGTHQVAGEGEPLFGMVQDCVTDLLNYEKYVVRNTSVINIHHLPSSKWIMLHPCKCTCWDSLCFSTSPKPLVDPLVSAASCFSHWEELWSLKTDRPTKKVGQNMNEAICRHHNSCLKNNPCYY